VLVYLSAPVALISRSPNSSNLPLLVTARHRRLGILELGLEIIKSMDVDVDDVVVNGGVWGGQMGGNE
jgi:hypothetical protein